MSIQTRLTVSFTCLFSIIVFGLALGSYLLVRNNLMLDLNKELQVAVDATALSALHELNEHRTAAGGEADLQSVLDGRSEAALPDAQILVRQGSRQAAYKAAIHPGVDLRSIPSERLGSGTIGNLRLASRDLSVRKFDSHYRIYAAASTVPVDQRLQQFALVLVLLLPIGLLLAASAGYLSARKSLAPLKELSKTIESVTSSGLDLRVSAVDGNDELSRIGRRFNSLLDRLQRAFALQQSFMANASHELRTPVTVALAAAQVTSRDLRRTREDSDEALRMVEQQMLRVKRIVQQLLLLSQADASALKINLTELYLDDIVAEASRAAQALARTKQQRFTVESLPEALIRGDADLLGQAVMILLDNAVKFTAAGGHVRVGITRRNAYWVCRVSDDGIGIPEPAQSHIFERFYRAPRDSRSKEAAGAGLGLAIAKAIVDNHGGALTLVESRPGYTCFEMELLSADRADPKESGRDQTNLLAVKM